MPSPEPAPPVAIAAHRSSTTLSLDDAPEPPRRERAAPPGERIALLEARIEAHEDADQQRHGELMRRVDEIRGEAHNDQAATRHEIGGIRQLLFAQLAVIAILTLGVLGIVGAAVSVQVAGVGSVEVGQQPRPAVPGAGSALDPLDDTLDAETALRPGGDPPILDGLASGEAAPVP